MDYENKILTVKDLKKWLEKCDDNAEVIIDYECSDCWYDYYGTINDVEIDEDKSIILKI